MFEFDRCSSCGAGWLRERRLERCLNAGCYGRIIPSGHRGSDLGGPRSTGVDSRSTDDLEGPQIFGNEAADVLVRFLVELQRATGDGARKRRTGSKPPWYRDDSHEAAMYRHLERWESGERHDPEHEAHPLVAAAWRALAIACRESGNVPSV